MKHPLIAFNYANGDMSSLPPSQMNGRHGLDSKQVVFFSSYDMVWFPGTAYASEKSCRNGWPVANGESRTDDVPKVVKVPSVGVPDMDDFAFFFQKDASRTHDVCSVDSWLVEACELNQDKPVAITFSVLRIFLEIVKISCEFLSANIALHTRFGHV